jgi:hypothetical protein
MPRGYRGPPKRKLIPALTGISPDASRTGVNIRAFPALQQD